MDETKTCQRCGKSYRRSDLKHRQSDKHWTARKFCSEACRREDAGERARLLRGENHPSWKGDDAKPNSARMRARRLYGSGGFCEVCGERAEMHHRDGNPHNNDRENIAWLCRTHHIEAHGTWGRKPVKPRTPEQREREREYRRRYELRKKGLLPPPSPPKGSEEDRAKRREATRRYRLRQKGLLPPPAPPKGSEDERRRSRERQRRYRQRLKGKL